MVGDIPDADAKPPENVLFVCTLNPVTTDEDLEIIFSRFGTIISCEVIRDQKTGDSLQYAFIEFENEEDCIKAYFKMDNVLIDDRRIHVDFSQSLAKVKGISRRKYSEEDPEGEGKGKKKDGLVAKKKTQEDGYEMVFGDVGAEEQKSERSKGSRDNGARSRERRDQRGDKGRGRDERRDGGRSSDERKREKGDEGRKEGDEGRKEREKRREGRDDYRERRKRSRSRSHDRHSHHKHHRHRRDGSRSRSRERHHRQH